jgi:polyferredoxin
LNRPTRVTQEPSSLGVNVLTFLVIWLVCALLAAWSWNNLVTNTPTVGGNLSISFGALLVLSSTFGLAGAGLVCFAISIVRDP